MEITHKNYKLLHEKFGIDIQNLPMRDDFKLEMTARGTPTLQIGSSYIHSRHDPEGEARRIISTTQEEGFDCWVFGGFGLGYHIESFIEENESAFAVVVEPEISFLSAAARSRNLEKILSCERVYLLVSLEPDSVTACLNTLQCEKIKYFQIRSEYSLNQAYFEKLKICISSYVSRKEINNNTLKRFGRLWVKNLAGNLAEFALSPGLVHLEERFRGIPALIIAGGPSLDSVLPYLRELGRKYLIIAVDTSYRACIASGIVPDITVVVDPQYWNSRHLDRCVCDGSILVSEPSSYTSIFRNFGGLKIFAGSVFPLGQYFETLTFSRGKIGAGGSVSTSAWDFARQSGCSEVLFAGLDLAYPGKQTHFRGSFFEERSHVLSSRTHPSSDMDFSLITDASLMEAESNSGEIVFTDKRLNLYKQWFEEQLILHDLKTFTLSSGGVKIRGMELIKIENALDKEDIREDIDKVTKAIKEFAAKYRTDKGLEYLTATEYGITSLIKSLGNIYKSSQEGKLASEKLLECNSKAPFTAEGCGTEIKLLLNKLDRVDSEILSEGERSIAGFLLQDTIRTISQENGEKDFNSVIGRSLRIYTDLLESIKLHTGYLKRSLEKITQMKAGNQGQ